MQNILFFLLCGKAGDGRHGARDGAAGDDDLVKAAQGVHVRDLGEMCIRDRLRRAPWFVLDGGHNPQCAQTVADNLARYFPARRITLLVGVLADKDLSLIHISAAPEPIIAIFMRLPP